MLMNNLLKSLNNIILLAKDKPIITMVEWIRSYLMSKFAHLKKNLSVYSENVMPKPSKRLNKEVQKSGNWIVI